MTADYYWTLPTRPVRRRPLPAGVTDLRPGRFTDFDHLAQIARAVEAVGFTGIFVPYDPQGEESWITATGLAREVPRLRILTEFQPGFATAVYTAKLALSFQRFFDDRLSWKLAIDTPVDQQHTVGDFVDGDDRLARAAELVTVVDGVWNEAPFTYVGEHFEVEAGGFFEGVSAANGGFSIARRSRPEIFLDGTSDAELQLSAAHADVHLFELAPRRELIDLIARHRKLADAHGRTVRYGLQLSVFAREFAGEAWRDAQRYWGDQIPDLVGSYDEIVLQLREIEELGVSTFIVESEPHLQSAYPFGEFVLSQLVGERALEFQS
jgi:alkanesulfonate monooxygenase